MKPQFLSTVFLAIITTCLVSLTVILVNKGFVTGFLIIWLKSWFISFIVAVPCIMIVGPKIESAVDNALGLKQKKR